MREQYFDYLSSTSVWRRQQAVIRVHFPHNHLRTASGATSLLPRYKILDVADAEVELLEIERGRSCE